jgi:hypothetical protein
MQKNLKIGKKTSGFKKNSLENGCTIVTGYKELGITFPNSYGDQNAYHMWYREQRE